MQLSEVISIDAAKCVNCHQCIAVCPVKFCNDGSGDHVSLNSDLCIGCGECVKACTHNARVLQDDFELFIKDVSASRNIVAVVAPAVAAQFEESYLNLNSWLKSIGIIAVFDVSFGAELTVKSYLEHINSNKPKAVIAQPCPAIVTYIELYKPELLKYLAPADSPMMHTMKMVKEFYPEYSNSKFVIISPCIAKKREFEEVGIGDYNVTMTKIREYLTERNIQLSSFPKTDYDNPPAERAVLFSTPGGLMRTAEREVKDIQRITRKIEGPELIYHYLDSLEKNITKGKAPLLIDCLNCEMGCNGGTGTSGNKTVDEMEYAVEKRSQEMQEKYKGQFNRKPSKRKIKKAVDKYWKPNLYGRKYKNLSSNLESRIKMPSRNELDKIYTGMMKTSQEDFRNCAACGYDCCEKMAVAVYNGLNKVENCHVYLEKNDADIAANLPAVKRFAGGDLTIEFKESGRGESALLFVELNKSISRIRNMMREVGGLIKLTTNSSTDICTRTDEIADGINEQSHKTNEASTAVQELNEVLNQTSSSSNEAAKLAESSLDLADQGGEVVKSTVESMREISEVITKSSVTVSELGTRSSEIGEIITVIDDIAEQTNLLALNAAIEAARAGEAGRGFAVVADEVGKLADKTTKATKEIANMILKIQEVSEETAGGIEKGVGLVKLGIDSAVNSGETLEKIIEGMKETLKISNRVAEANEEESIAVEQINNSITEINGVSINTVDKIVNVKNYARELKSLTDELEKSFRAFILDTEGSNKNFVISNSKIISN